MQGQERDKNQLSWVPVSPWKKLSGKGGERMNEGEEGHHGAPSEVGRRSQDKAHKEDKEERKTNIHECWTMNYLMTGPGLSHLWPGKQRGILNDC